MRSTALSELAFAGVVADRLLCSRPPPFALFVSLGVGPFVALALLLTASPVRAADPCTDLAEAIAPLKEGDAYPVTTQLFRAARLGCEREARALLDRGAALDGRDREGATALACAAQAGKVKLVSLLLDKGANVNARSVDGSTPLFFAEEADRQQIARLLLDRGADPNIAGRSGLRPLAAAGYNGAEDAVRLLLQRGADPAALDDGGQAAIVYAAGQAHAPIVSLLLDAGVDVNRRYAHNLTALMWAAGPDASAGVEDVEKTVRLLVERGAALELKDDRSMTAADIARSAGRDNVAKILSR
jgi:ankyrin repeat protein